MKNNTTDEKLDTMLKTLCSSQVPEDIQFHPDTSEEIQVSVNRHKKRPVLKTAAVCAAALVILFPLVKLHGDRSLSSPDPAPSVTQQKTDTEHAKETEEFYADLEKYTFESFEMKSSSFYRNFSEDPFFETDMPVSTGTLIYTGLIPYEYVQTEGTKLYVRVINDGQRNVYTRQAYLVRLSEDGNISELMKTTETVSDSEEELISGEDQFKGVKNADAGIKSITSKFRRKDSPVVLEGITVREPTDAGAECTCENSAACFAVRSGEKLVPELICEFISTVDRELPETENSSGSSVETLHLQGKTVYHTFAAYDCTRKNALKTKPDHSNDIWENVFTEGK